jgi:hypothetical protein
MNQLWKTPNVLKRNNEHESEEKNIKNEERILALEERRLDLREWAAKIRLLELHNIQFENVFSSSSGQVGGKQLISRNGGQDSAVLFFHNNLLYIFLKIKIFRYSGVSLVSRDMHII